ncbi:MAG: zinc ABC transporter substrate-binding protein [Gammaproteobacteria bacterium]|nr:zinc ABC transporter substrate-binding protein [Gammaproteobacteria bacterium]
MRLGLDKVLLNWLLVFAVGWPSQTTAAPEVVVSIKPVHSLIAGVMTGVGAPELLARGARSPHNLHLSPSDVRKLSHADLVFWVGQGLESALAKVLLATVDGSRRVTLISLPGMQLLPLRQGGVWDRHSHAENSDVQDGHATVQLEHEHIAGLEQQVNSHIWLSPVNAGRIVESAAAALSRIDPENAAHYQRNAELMLARIRMMEQELGRQLSPVSGAPYVVFHDAYAYFEHHYGLNAVGSVTVNPEHLPGARSIQRLRSKIKSLNARCVFSEPQFEPGVVRTLLEGSTARGGRLDPLGADIPAGPDAYFLMMEQLAAALVDCLQ